MTGGWALSQTHRAAPVRAAQIGHALAALTNDDAFTDVAQRSEQISVEGKTRVEIGDHEIQVADGIHQQRNL